MRALLAIALAIAASSASADTLRITSGKTLFKYEGTVALILPPTANSAAELDFIQGSGLPIGGGHPMIVAGEAPGSMPWRVLFIREEGTVELVCHGPIPTWSTADNEFHFHLTCGAQP